MGYLDDTVDALLAATGSIHESSESFAAILTNVDRAMAHLTTASDHGFADLKGRVSELRQSVNAVRLLGLNVASQIEEKAVALDNGQ